MNDEVKEIVSDFFERILSVAILMAMGFCFVNPDQYIGYFIGSWVLQNCLLMGWRLGRLERT